MLERCLVVDDHEMIRETIAIMATSLGFKESITATDGADAISKLFHQRPSFIITDLQMEPIDGLEMLRLIRSGRYGLPHDIPIIILTANASEDVISQCIAFDVDAFLVKPVDRESLKSRINQLSQRTKPKNDVAHYFKMYQQDPAKSTAFQIHASVDFSANDDREFNHLLNNQHVPATPPNNTADTETYQTADKQDNRKLFIKWQQRFSVGQAELDDSNRHLLNIINDTYQLILENKEGFQAFEDVSRRFQEYVKEHILVEEALLERHHYPRLKVHKEIHARLIKQADFVALKCQADPSFYKTDFFKLLRYWWVKHIVQEDCKYKSIFTSSNSNQ